jgi:hypothetical protein
VDYFEDKACVDSFIFYSASESAKPRRTPPTQPHQYLLGHGHAKQHAAPAKYLRGTGLAHTPLTLARKKDLSCSVQFPHSSDVRARICQTTCGACQAHARCRLGARTLLTLAGKEDLSCSVQCTPKLSLLGCCNHANRRAYACETLVNTQVPVSPPCSDIRVHPSCHC